MAAFEEQWQGWLVATGTGGLAKVDGLLSGPLQKKCVHPPLLQTLKYYLQLAGEPPPAQLPGQGCSRGWDTDQSARRPATPAPGGGTRQATLLGTPPLSCLGPCLLFRLSLLLLLCLSLPLSHFPTLE